MTANETEFIAALAFPKGSRLGIQEVAARFENSLRTVIAAHPAIEEYFVQAIEEMSEVHVGLRFKMVDPDLVDGWANELLAEAFDVFKQSGGLGRAADLKREDSSLIVG